MLKKFLPWFRRDWRPVEDARYVFSYMSVQALTIGGLALTAFIYAGFSKGTILGTLAITVAMAIYGSTVDQPELRGDGDE